MFSASWRLCGAAVLSVGCLYEPSIVCDDTRVSWGFADHEISAADDVSAEPGVQIDVLLHSALPEGRGATLTVTGEDDVDAIHPEDVRVSIDGTILFHDVNVPIGEVVFSLRTSNDCREVESRNRRFVIDERGPAVCVLEFVPPTREIPDRAPLRAYIAADDQDPILPQAQVAIRVETGRAQMAIRLLRLAAGVPTSDERTTDESGETTFAISLGQGEVAIRALCAGGPNDQVLSTATFPVLVDTVPPDCEIVAPSSRVTAADDLDGNSGNGLQVLAVAQTTDETNAGLEALFSVNGSAAEPAVIGDAGQAAVVVTVPVGGGSQDFSVELPDLAGNLCTAQVSF